MYARVFMQELWVTADGGYLKITSPPNGGFWRKTFTTTDVVNKLSGHTSFKIDARHPDVT